MQMTRCVYKLSGNIYGVPITTILKDTDYMILGWLIHAGILYVEGPRSEDFIAALRSGGIYTLEVPYFKDPYEKDRKGSPVVMIHIIHMLTSLEIPILTHVIQDIVNMFIEELTKRLTMCDRYVVKYRYDELHDIILIELPSVHHAYIACNPNNPIFEARVYKCMYLYSVNTSKYCTLVGKSVNTYTYENDMPVLLDE